MLKKDKVNAAIRVTMFSCILILTVYGTGKLFTPFNAQDTNQAETFYRETEKNSVDVLTVGGSTVMVGISNLDLWKEEGIAAQTRCNSVQAPIMTYYSVKESYKYQKPEVVIIGVKAVLDDYDYDKYEGFMRRAMDFKRPSLLKVKVAATVVSESEYQSFLSYMFPLLRYHARWNQFSPDDFDNLEHEYDYMHGQYAVYKIKEIAKPDWAATSVEEVDYSEESWKWYKKSAEFCKSQGSDVVFALYPYRRWSRGKSITISALADEVGAKMLDLNDDKIISEYGIDWSKDFYNDHHLNAMGARKATKYVAKFLRENCNLPDRGCSEDVAAQLDRDLEQYERDLAEFREKKYDIR